MASLIRSLSSESQSLKDQGKSRTCVIDSMRELAESQSLKDQGKSRTPKEYASALTTWSQSLKDQGKSRTDQLLHHPLR